MSHLLSFFEPGINASIPRRIILYALLMVTVVPSKAQSKKETNQYGLYIQRDVNVFSNEIKHDKNKALIELKSLIPDLRYDLRYAGKNNFLKQRMYPGGTTTTYLRAEAALALKEVADSLKTIGYGLIIFDAYRPYSVTEKFWQLVHDDRYVANPSRGSGHNRGIAVDLTLYSLGTSEQVDMGTDFDHFTDSAHHSFTGLEQQIVNHRSLLKNIMESKGFKSLPTEWWHYSWPNTRNFELLDIPFRQIRKYESLITFLSN